MGHSFEGSDLFQEWGGYINTDHYIICLLFNVTVTVHMELLLERIIWTGTRLVKNMMANYKTDS